ncbi:MAG: FAD binding domain-containing protein [bacterium]
MASILLTLVQAIEKIFVLTTCSNSSILLEKHLNGGIRFVLSNLKRYYRPKTIPEALALLEKNSGSILIIAGGTKLVKSNNTIVQELVDVTSLELDYIREDEGLTRIGATTSLQKVAEYELVKKLANGILSQAARSCHFSRMIRNVSTTGGTLITSNSLSPLYCALLVLQAQIRIAGGEEFALPMNVFLNKKTLGGGLLVEVIIPGLEPQTYAAIAPIFHSQKSIICACARITLAKRACKSAKIAITGTERIPQRLHDIEKELEGKEFTAETIDEIASKAQEAYVPISDSLASKEYRQEVSRIVIKRALNQCLEAARESII